MPAARSIAAWGLAGAFFGALAVIAVPLLLRRASAPPLVAPLAAVPKTGERSALPKLAGDLDLVGKAFMLEDLQGNVVLDVGRFSGWLDLDAVRRGVIRMPRGQVDRAKVLVRRGRSGRVTLSEAVRGSDDPSEPSRERSATALDLGPLAVRDAQLTVELSDRPIVIRVDEAQLRIQRTPEDLAPKIFLSGVRGELVAPDPLPQPVTVRGAEGVVRLEGGPLVDLRTRVCLGDSEMKLRIEIPERRARADLTVDPRGPLGYAGLFALGLVSKVKSDKLEVSSGEVSVREAFDCAHDEPDGDSERPGAASSRAERGER